MKKLDKILIVFILLVLPVTLSAKEFDLSITGSIGYGHAKWGSGYDPQPGGTLEKSAIIYNPSIQIKYTRWVLQPTIEFNYRWAEYNFRTYQAPIQKMEPRAWSLLGGLTYDLNLLSVYGLVGITRYNANVSLFEAHPRLLHGTELPFKSDLFSYKVGAYKLFKVGPIKVGPELSLQGWNKQPGWRHCREGREGVVQPNAGLRIQW
jgi:opacity protein-like surface antigen